MVYQGYTIWFKWFKENGKPFLWKGKMTRPYEIDREDLSILVGSKRGGLNIWKLFPHHQKEIFVQEGDKRRTVEKIIRDFTKELTKIFENKEDEKDHSKIKKIKKIYDQKQKEIEKAEKQMEFLKMDFNQFIETTTLLKNVDYKTEKTSEKELEKIDEEKELKQKSKKIKKPNSKKQSKVSPSKKTKPSSKKSTVIAKQKKKKVSRKKKSVVVTGYDLYAESFLSRPENQDQYLRGGWKKIHSLTADEQQNFIYQGWENGITIEEQTEWNDEANKLILMH